MQQSDETHSDFDHESAFAAHKVDGSSIGFEEMTLDVLMVRYGALAVQIWC